MKLVFLGTTCAMVKERYNTCFLLKSEKGTLLVDGGGGNEVLKRLAAVGQNPGEIDGMFLSHSHCDHIFGAAWVLRVVGEQMSKGKRDADFSVYGCKETLADLETICRITMNKNTTKWFGTRIQFCCVEDGEEFEAAGYRLKAFDILSTKLKQFGFTMALPEGGTFCFAGDEPINEKREELARDAQWLLSEAFCLYADRDTYKPYEKHHVTSKDAAALAQRLNVKNLVIYHTVDYPERRKERMTGEAQKEYSGNIYVPEDLEEIVIR